MNNGWTYASISTMRNHHVGFIVTFYFSLWRSEKVYQEKRARHKRGIDFPCRFNIKYCFDNKSWSRHGSLMSYYYPAVLDGERSRGSGKANDSVFPPLTGLQHNNATSYLLCLSWFGLFSHRLRGCCCRFCLRADVAC